MRIFNPTNGSELEITDEFFKAVDLLAERLEFFKSIRYYPYVAIASSDDILKTANQCREINAITDEVIDHMMSGDSSPFVRDACADLIHHKYTCDKLIKLLENFAKEGE